MKLSTLSAAAVVLLLSACGGVPEQPAPGANAAMGETGAANAATSVGGDVAALPDAVPSAATAPATPIPSATAPMPDGIRSCAASIGDAAAKRLADLCRRVSPATRPPCNAANSCAIIRDEIARSCELFRDDPPAECGQRPEAQRAADVVRRYYEALDARDYSVAYAQWGGNGEASGKSYDAFAAGFADTRDTRVTVTGPVEVDGGAGSLFATVPVTVDALLADGKRQRFRGNYAIRRVNDVDGSTAEQRRWHIASATLKPA